MINVHMSVHECLVLLECVRREKRRMMSLTSPEYGAMLALSDRLVEALPLGVQRDLAKGEAAWTCVEPVTGRR